MKKVPIHAHVLCTSPHRNQNHHPVLPMRKLSLTGERPLAQGHPVNWQGLDLNPGWPHLTLMLFPSTTSHTIQVRKLGGNHKQLNSHLHVYIFQNPLWYNEQKMWGPSQGVTGFTGLRHNHTAKNNSSHIWVWAEPWPTTATGNSMQI